MPYYITGPGRDSAQATSLKTTAGQVYKASFYNVGTSPAYVRFYDETGVPTTSNTPVYRMVVPANTSGAGCIDTFPDGMQFTSGIGFRCTGGAADNDATALQSGAVYGNVLPK